MYVIHSPPPNCAHDFPCCKGVCSFHNLLLQKLRSKAIRLDWRRNRVSEKNRCFLQPFECKDQRPYVLHSLNFWHKCHEPPWPKCPIYSGQQAHCSTRYSLTFFCYCDLKINSVHPLVKSQVKSETVGLQSSNQWIGCTEPSQDLG